MPVQLLDTTLMVDLILALLVAEALLLYALKRYRHHGPGLLSVLPTLVSGALLLIALRSVLVGAWPGWTGLALALAGIAHVLDLSSRNSRWR